MDVGDVLHLRFLDEVGVVPDIILNVRKEDGTTNEEEAPDAPTALDASDITDVSFVANWDYTENTLGFYLDVAEDSAFTSMVAGYDNLDVGLVNEYDVTGLMGFLSYYYRLRGYNDYGTSGNSNTITLTTLMEEVTDFDGNIYTYITVGTQQWLVENLKTTHYDDGVAIPNLTLNADWVAEDGTPGHDGAYCWYNNDAVTYADYGCLYNWYAVDNAHGLAPTGWRVPTNTDWITLSDYLGGVLVAGGKLKEAGTTYWFTPNMGATNESSFSGRGGGWRSGSGSFQFLTVFGNIHSSEDITPTNGYYARMQYDSAEFLVTNHDKIFGSSVRCMRDV